MAATDPVTHEPRRFTVRLPRPLWIGMATVGLIFVAFSLRIGVPIYRQQAALHEIGELDGALQTLPRGPQWLRELAGDERTRLFDEVVLVDLSYTHATDATLVHLKGLTGLKWILPTNTRVTDNGLATFEGSSDLQSLWLQGTRVTDSGIVYLKGLAKLDEIWLDRTQVTDAGAAELERALPRLTIHR